MALPCLIYSTIVARCQNPMEKKVKITNTVEPNRTVARIVFESQSSCTYLHHQLQNCFTASDRIDQPDAQSSFVRKQDKKKIPSMLQNPRE